MRRIYRSRAPAEAGDDQAFGYICNASSQVAESRHCRKRGSREWSE
jgi:hypothetical protein